MHEKLNELGKFNAQTKLTEQAFNIFFAHLRGLFAQSVTRRSERPQDISGLDHRFARATIGRRNGG